jgi:hypothetical protein
MFDKFVIKIPKLKGGNLVDMTFSFLEFYSEHWITLFCKRKYRKYILPVYFIPFIPISIQKKVYVEDASLNKNALKYKLLCDGIYSLTDNGNTECNITMFEDCYWNNVGVDNGQPVLIDYGIFHASESLAKCENVYWNIYNFLRDMLYIR